MALVRSRYGAARARAQAELRRRRLWQALADDAELKVVVGEALERESTLCAAPVADKLRQLAKVWALG